MPRKKLRHPSRANRVEVTLRQYRTLRAAHDLLERRFRALLSQLRRAGIIH